jgi:predicted DNA-binding transcriptional regulator YafY
VSSKYNQFAFALEILRLLAQKPRFRQELADLLGEYLEAQGQTSGDVLQKLTRTIAKLRNCGFHISCAPNHPYTLLESNLPLLLSSQQKEALYLATYLLSSMGFATQAEQIGKLYDFSADEEPTRFRVDFSPPVDYSSDKVRQTIQQLEERIQQQCRYTIRYQNSRGEVRLWDLDRSELRFHNGVLYLFSFVPDWSSRRFSNIPNVEQNILFHINRIQSVNAASNVRWFYDFPTIKIRYALTGALANYQPRRKNEQVIKRNLEDKVVVIETTEDYLFWFRQRILQYGANAQLLDPIWLREQIKEELNKSYNNYSKT